jgi:hypothetical protein
LHQLSDDVKPDVHGSLSQHFRRFRQLGGSRYRNPPYPRRLDIG